MGWGQRNAPPQPSTNERRIVPASKTSTAAGVRPDGPSLSTSLAIQIVGAAGLTTSRFMNTLLPFELIPCLPALQVVHAYRRGQIMIDRGASSRVLRRNDE